MGRERTESGQYAKTVTIDRVRQVFNTVAGPTVTIADIASGLGVTAKAARRKLNKFHSQGMLGKRKTAGWNIYWLEPAGDVTDINPEDPVWGTDPIPGDETVSEADANDVLYGEINGYRCSSISNYRGYGDALRVILSASGVAHACA